MAAFWKLRPFWQPAGCGLPHNAGVDGRLHKRLLSVVRVNAQLSRRSSYRYDSAQRIANRILLGFVEPVECHVRLVLDGGNHRGSSGSSSPSFLSVPVETRKSETASARKEVGGDVAAGNQAGRASRAGGPGARCPRRNFGQARRRPCRERTDCPPIDNVSPSMMRCATAGAISRKIARARQTAARITQSAAGRIAPARWFRLGARTLSALGVL